MTNLRKLRLLALMLLLSLAVMSPGLAGPGSYDIIIWEELLVTEAQPIPENSCKEAPTATVNLEGFAADGGDLTVINDKATGSDDVLKIYANVNGAQRLFLIPIALHSGTSRMVHVTYLQPVTFPSISLCKRGNTVGIVDSPDPVVSARMAPPPDEVGGGGDPTP